MTTVTTAMVGRHYKIYRPRFNFLLTGEGVSLDFSSHATVCVCVSEVRDEGWEDFQDSQVVFTCGSQHLSSTAGQGEVDEVFQELQDQSGWS